jgi:hypothetical protein
MTGIKAVYNPPSIGRPASCAYAIDCGIKINETLNHAIISLFKTPAFFNSLNHFKNGKILYR